MNLPINKEQKIVTKNIIETWKTNNKQVLAWYTGSGKTNVFLNVIREVLKKEPDAKIGVSCYLHLTIKNQTFERSAQFFDDSQAYHSREQFDKTKNVFFFNPQSIFRKDFNIKFDYFIIDEAHVGFGEKSKIMFEEIFKKFTSNKTKLLFVTATPWTILNHKRVKGAAIHKRGLDAGFFDDKRIADFKIHLERFTVVTKSEDFHNGELKESFVKRNFELIKISSINMVKNLLKKNVGDKVLIIVNRGNTCEIAHELKKTLGKNCLTLVSSLESDRIKSEDEKRERETIEQFKTNPDIRFLVVVNKLQVGFDMPELDTTIDCTMTRNIGLLVQRWGRLARKNDNLKHSKNYYYCVDDSMTPEESEWILGTSIKHAVGEWTVVFKKNETKRAETEYFGFSNNDREYSIDLLKLIDLYKNQKHLSSRKFTLLKQEPSGKAGKWTKEALIEECKRYKDRTELSEKNRYVYKRMMKHFKTELDLIFPKKVKNWTIEQSLDLAKKFDSANAFRKAYPSAHWLLIYKGYREQMNKIIYG